MFISGATTIRYLRVHKKAWHQLRTRAYAVKSKHFEMFSHEKKEFYNNNHS